MTKEQKANSRFQRYGSDAGGFIENWHKWRMMRPPQMQRLCTRENNGEWVFDCQEFVICVKVEEFSV